MSDLVVIVPSRGRPHTMAEMARAFDETCTAGTRLVFAIDDDDPTRMDYMADEESRCAGTFFGSGFCTSALVTFRGCKSGMWDRSPWMSKVATPACTAF